MAGGVHIPVIDFQFSFITLQMGSIADSQIGVL